MAGVGNISQIEMSYMNSMIALARAYQNSEKLICLKVDDREIFVKKDKIVEIQKNSQNGEIFYCVVTEWHSYPISKEQGEKLIKEW